MEKEKIGFIGLGIMGQPMATHIAQAGYSLTVFNRTQSKTKSLAQLGVQVAPSPRQLAETSSVIIVMVSDTPDVEEVVLGSEGVLEGIQPGSLVVDMSTVSPELERLLDGRLMERGCALIDAPVSGGDVGAQNGTLAIMAGGRRDLFDRVRPLFDIMGKSAIHCGPVGSGQLTKLCNQILVSVNLLAVCEALLFAHDNQLDAETMIEAVKGGAAGSWQLSNLGPEIAAANYEPGFMVDLIQKDLGIVMEVAGKSCSPLQGVSLVHQLFRSCQAWNEGRKGTQVLAKVLKRLGNQPA